ncbi:MAG TPA: hypothetical protein PK990_02495 [Salinivirgaceae bacterium]|nr:hypothetical protein [Salinivirgaceae bacterium]
MNIPDKSKNRIVDGSRIIIEAMARAGADAFIGYPITPANLLYSYSSQRMPIMLAAPDEITTLQWMSGLAVAGHIPVTATSFPGFALMIESINMAYMMELPMVIILVQRLGPATGTATCGAQGDLTLLRGMISGGHPLPVLCTSSYEDCWTLSAKAVEIAVKLRTPVILLTSKEEVMTQKSFDLTKLHKIEPIRQHYYNSDEPYKPYKPIELIPEFLPVGQKKHQVRLTASTHNQAGILMNTDEEAIANTVRLEEKVKKYLPEYTFYDYHTQSGAKNLVIAFGITAGAAKDAVAALNSMGIITDLLIPKTMIPTPEKYISIISKYQKAVVAEENINNQFSDMIFGTNKPSNHRFVAGIGKMITPQQIIKEVQS